MRGCSVKETRKIIQLNAPIESTTHTIESSQAAPRWFLGMGWVFGRRTEGAFCTNVDVPPSRSTRFEIGGIGDHVPFIKVMT